MDGNVAIAAFEGRPLHILGIGSEVDCRVFLDGEWTLGSLDISMVSSPWV